MDFRRVEFGVFENSGFKLMRRTGLAPTFQARASRWYLRGWVAVAGEGGTWPIAPGRRGTWGRRPPTACCHQKKVADSYRPGGGLGCLQPVTAHVHHKSRGLAVLAGPSKAPTEPGESRNGGGWTWAAKPPVSEALSGRRPLFGLVAQWAPLVTSLL